jgi:outer membrane protein OmpA-like peptidoglycan-associated protein
MSKHRPLSRGTLLAGALLAAMTLGACAPKVTRDQFNTEVAKLREEMQTGDKANSDRIDALEKDLQSFRSEYQVSMERMQGMLKFNVPVHFEFDRAELREGDRPLLDRFAGVVKEHYPNAVITVEGFADPVGSTRYNQRLAQRRAESVKGYLVSSGGLGDANLRTVSYGEARNRQIVQGAGGPGEGLENRRVALVVDYAQMDQAEQAPPAAAQ